jgi:hypothetical protein
MVEFLLWYTLIGVAVGVTNYLGMMVCRVSG